MSERRQLGSGVIAVAAAVAIVVAVAALLPRAFLVNDDSGLILYLRSGVFTPWISPILVRGLIAAYHQRPDVPWYGLYQYALVAASGAVILHTGWELIDRRPGLGQVATRLGAGAFLGSVVLTAAGLTWTVVSIVALGTGAAALVAHLHAGLAAGARGSPLRALAYGALLASGYLLRMDGLGAMIAALLPLFGWLALEAWRVRRLPSIVVGVAGVVPLALVLALQHRIPQPHGVEREPINLARGQIHGQNAFANLDTRAPELLARAGWTVDEYRDFANWSFIDDQQFTLAKLQRLVDTGGRPTPITLASARATVRGIVDDAPAAVWLFATVLAGAALLGWLGVIAPARGLALALGYLACELAVPVWMSSKFRFPLRVSLPFYLVAAFGAFVILAREIAVHRGEHRPVVAHRAGVALVVGAALLFAWARSAVAWVDRPAQGYTPEIRAFLARVHQRGGFLLPQAGITDFDPLVANPAGYAGLPAGWGTFTQLWYDYLARFGLTHGGQVLPWMIDNPDAYVLATLGGRPQFEDWCRRLLGADRVRLAVVDVAGTPAPDSVALFHLVSGPLVRDSAEWRVREQVAWTQEAWLPGPPAVDARALAPVAFAAPYAAYAAPLRAAAPVELAPIAGGVRAQAAPAADDGCPRAGADGVPIGVRVPVDGLAAARLELTLLGAQDVRSVHVLMEAADHRTARWRWDLGDDAHQFGFHGAFTLVPGHGARRLQWLGGSAAPAQITALYVYVTVEPGARAGFELRALEVAELGPGARRRAEPR